MARAPRRAVVRRRRRQPRRAPRQPDSAALRGIKQGTGRTVVQAFGTAPRRATRVRRRGKRMQGYHPCHHDAFHFAHLPLPRPTGPYTVIRTTQLITTGSKLTLVGPTYDRVKSRWTNIAALSYNDGNVTPASNNNMKRYVFNALTGGSWNGAQITPAAFSVQLMNPGALQTTTGIVYAGRIRTAWKISENLTTAGAASANQFISYNNPRLLAAAKLAFRGVQVDCVPFNMSELANFTPVEELADGDFTASASTPDFNGFAPIFFWNPNNIANLQFLVCCEWRVRFDPSNPAQASHTQHTHAPESMWMQALHTAEAIGNGVIDIADKVAETGNAVFGAAAGTYRAARGMRALQSGMTALALGA